jgi:dCMP deaminase
LLTDRQFFNIAEEVALSGTCSRLKVAALIVPDNRIASSGYNGTARGLPHCHHHDNKPCHKSVHAEANAIVFAARYGIKTLDSTMYCTHAPCDSCAGLIINAGIKVLKYKNSYRNDNGLYSLATAGVEVIQYESSTDQEFSVSH